MKIAQLNLLIGIVVFTSACQHADQAAKNAGDTFNKSEQLSAPTSIEFDRLQRAKSLYADGHLKLAEENLQSLLADGPSNKVARYYLDLVQQKSKTNQQQSKPSSGLWYPTLPPRPMDR